MVLRVRRPPPLLHQPLQLQRGRAEPARRGAPLRMPAPFLSLHGEISSAARAGIRTHTPSLASPLSLNQNLVCSWQRAEPGSWDFSRRRSGGPSISLPFYKHLLYDKGLQHRESSFLALALLPASTLPSSLRDTFSCTINFLNILC